MVPPIFFVKTAERKIYNFSNVRKGGSSWYLLIFLALDSGETSEFKFPIKILQNDSREDSSDVSKSTLTMFSWRYLAR